MSDAREDLAAELRRLAEEAHRRALREGAASPAPPPPALREPTSFAKPSLESAPAPPDASAVNAGWRVDTLPPRGLLGLLYRLFARILGPRWEAQRAFNAKQVQLHNETLRYIDHALGLHGRHIDEINERHVILERELVAHVRELVERIDLVLSEGDRGRLALEFAIEDLRARLARLEEARPRRDR